MKKLLLFAIILISIASCDQKKDPVITPDIKECVIKNMPDPVRVMDYTPTPERNRIKKDVEFVIERYPKNGFYAVKYGSKYLEYSYGEFRLMGFYFAEKCKTKTIAKRLIEKYIEQHMKKGVTYEVYKSTMNK